MKIETGRRCRTLLVVLLALSVLSVLAITVNTFSPRYQLAAVQGIMVRLDTRTGSMWAFALGPQNESLPRDVAFLNLASWEGPGAGILQALLDVQ